MIVEITSTLEQFSTHLTSIGLDLGGDLGRDLGGDLGVELGRVQVIRQAGRNLSHFARFSMSNFEPKTYI